jgi:hypothetical protein
MGLGLSICVFERSMSVREWFAKRAGGVAKGNRATLLDDTAVALPSPAYEGMVSRVVGPSDRLVGLIIELLGVGLVQRPDSAASGGP